MLFLSPGVSCTKRINLQSCFLVALLKLPGRRRVLPRGREQKVARASAGVLRTWPKGRLWAAPGSVKLRAQTVPFPTGRCFAPNGIR